MLNFQKTGLKEELIAEVEALALPPKADPSLAPQLEHFKAFIKAEIAFARGRGLQVTARHTPNSPTMRQFNISISTVLP